MLRLWQKLILVGNNGHMVYQGNISEISQYLSKQNYILTKQEEISPVEYVMELLNNTKENAKLVALWKEEEKEQKKSYMATRSNDNNTLSHFVGEKEHTESSQTPKYFNDSKINNIRIMLPFMSQVKILLERHFLYTVLMLHGVRGMMIRNIVGGIFYGVLYYRNGNKLWDLKLLYDPTTLSLSEWVYNVTAICFSVPLFALLINGPPIPAMYAMKKYCDKEQVSVVYM